jgi:hypothetical protein
MACAFDTPRWEGTSDLTPLALRPGGPPFVRVNGGAARLSIPVGPAIDTLLALEDDGLFVHGHVAAKATVLRPNRPFVLNGFAIPTIFARLSFTEGADGALTVTHPAGPDLEVIDAPLRAQRPCGDLGLEGGAYDAATSVPGADAERKKVTVKALLPGKKPVALALEPGKKPVARIRVTEATLVDVHESRKGQARVSLPLNTLIVFGWVKASDLQKAGDMAGYGTGSGRLGVRDPQWTVEERLRCDADVPLMAEVDGVRATVGVIRKDKEIEVLGRAGDEARVWVRTKAIHAADGAVLRVRAADLAACRRVGEQ